MKSKLNFYLFLAALVVLDSVLLRSPNLLGKVGLIIYKYHYLRTFPKALFTVTLVVGVSAILAEVVHFSVRREVVKRITGRLMLFLFALASVIMFVKTALDFTTWSYAHTGLRFRIGAQMLPVILVLVFTRSWFTLPKIEKPFPVSPVTDDKTIDTSIK